MLYPLSYWGIDYHSIVPKKSPSVNQKTFFLCAIFPFIFHRAVHILSRVVIVKGGNMMRETNDPYADLDDLIFDEDDGGPSER